MSKVVPLFREPDQPATVLCACCGKDVTRRHQLWRRLRWRLSNGAAALVTTTSIVVALAYTGLLAVLLWSTVERGAWWMVAMGFAVFHVMRLFAFATQRVLGGPVMVHEHYHAPVDNHLERQA